MLALLAMNTMEEFLAHVLPNEGNYAAFCVETKQHYFTRNVGQLAAWIAARDQEGKTVYHACASFDNERRRRGNNARAARLFWLDIDSQVTHPDARYADPQECAEAVLEFCQQTGLPVPLFVGSGGGINVYWPLANELEPGTWRTYSRNLKRLAQAHLLAADPARTSDIASILRTPGTRNRKNGIERLVQCGELVGPYNIEQFEVLNDGSRSPGRKNNESHSGKLAATIACTFDAVDRLAEPIARDCKQISFLRDLKGNIIEPRWHACIGVLAWCTDGEEKIHEWSSGYPDYTFEETQDYIERAKKTTGATTCEHFHSLKPEICETCPYWQKIKSPISLGRVDFASDRPETEKTTSRNGKADTPFAQESSQNYLNGLPDLPETFHWNKIKALTTKYETAKGGTQDIVISDYPIYLDAIQTGENKGEWNYIFKQYLPERQWFDVPVSAASLFSHNAGSELASKGLNILDHGQFIRYARAAISQHYRTKKMSTRFNQFGWKPDGSFLYGLDLYRPDGAVDQVTGSEEIWYRCEAQNWIGPAPGGSLETWKEIISALFMPGAESQTAAVLSSFAAPLMRFQDIYEGGCILHYVTEASATGKSTGLIGATSVWGQFRGFQLINTDTKVSRGAALATMCNLPVVHDELALRDPAAIREFIELFTEGRDKNRGTRSGEIKHSVGNWQTIMLSAANVSLVDMLKARDKGPAARVMEFGSELPANARMMQGEKMRAMLSANAGYAGQAYLRWLVQHQNLEWTKLTLSKITEQLWESGKFQSEHRFWVRTVAAMLTAAVIVRQQKIVENFEIGRVRDWLFGQVRDQMANRIPYNHPIARFLLEFRDRTLVVAKPTFSQEKGWVVKKDPMRELYIRYNETAQLYYISLEALRAWMQEHEYNYKEVMKIAGQNRIILTPKKNMTLGGGTDAPGGQVWCCEVDGKHPAISDSVMPLDTNVVQMAKVKLTPRV